MKTTILTILTFVLSSFSLMADEALKARTATLDTLLSATQDNDLEKFESVCDENMKKAMTEELLKKISTHLSAVMKQGYKKLYMGALDRGPFKTYYWKIDFDKEGAQDVLAELSISNHKVAGFLIR